MSQIDQNTVVGEADASGQIPPQSNEVNSGLNFEVATSLDQVVGAWRLVYSAYRRSGFVDANPYGIHTSHAAVRRQNAVIVGCINGVTASTMTCIHDGDAGLPLDLEYQQELDALRHRGRKIIEVGLFADRRAQLVRITASLFTMMQYVHNDSLLHDRADIVIGVHPRHARFYTNAFGFQVYGSERSYATVNDRPVILLKYDHDISYAANPLPRGLRHFAKHPIPPDALDHRFDFDPHVIAKSPIGQYLSWSATTSENPGSAA